MDLWQQARKEIAGIAAKAGKLDAEDVEACLERPPESVNADLALPCFAFSKSLRRKPADISFLLAAEIEPRGMLREVNAAGPYLNFRLDWTKAGNALLESVLKQGKGYGSSNEGKGNRVMVEYSAPNTNKPLHLGHLRNQSIGMSLSRILEFAGNRVIKANLYNDRGTHICKAMLAYQRYGRGKKPGKKSDHFVGDFYVMYEKRKDKKSEEAVRDMLVKWEQGEREVRALWKRLRSWAVKGFRETYSRFGSEFDVEFFESDFWDKAGPIVKKAKRAGLFREQDGALVASLEKHGLPDRVVVRSDGTAIYITNDLALTKHKFEKYRIDRSIWVVGSEQNLYFQQLFKIFELLGYRWVKDSSHLSHGLVNLPEGRMKSREGKVVDADDMIEEVIGLARKEVRKREKLPSREIEKRAAMIGLAGLKYFLLRIDPARDMLYNPEESISFEGNTGPYVQYTHARSCSILRKAGAKRHPDYRAGSPTEEREIQLLKILAAFPDAVSRAARELKPNLIANYSHELATAFNEFYQAVPVLRAEKEKRGFRLALVTAVRTVLENALNLMDIKAPERM
jgi:arginyl-tRNA synthetase